MASNPQSNVAYAIDLLKAHQIRRENAFLHDEFQNIKNELLSVQDTITGLTKITETERKQKNGMVALLDDNISRISLLRQNASDAQIQLKDAVQRISKLEYGTDACNKVQGRVIREMKEDINGIRANVKDIESNQRESDDRHQFTQADIRERVDNKADKVVLKAVEAKLELLIAKYPHQLRELYSKTRIEGNHTGESLEETQIDTQVLDARTLTCHPKVLQLSGLTNFEDLDAAAVKVISNEEMRSRESTVSEDIDLDEYVTTPSYALHFKPVRIPSVDLAMLPQLDTNQTENCRKQRSLNRCELNRHENFSAEVLSPDEELIKEQEEKDIERLTEVLGSDMERKCLRRWLKVSGWTKESIAFFATVCSSSTDFEGRDWISSILPGTSTTFSTLHNRLNREMTTKAEEPREALDIPRARNKRSSTAQDDQSSAKAKGKRRQIDSLNGISGSVTLPQPGRLSMKRKAKECSESMEDLPKKRERKKRRHQMAMSPGLADIVCIDQSIFQSHQFDKESLLDFLWQPIPRNEAFK